MKKIISICILLLLVFHVHGQDRFAALEQKLTALAKDVTGLNANVDLSVNNVSVQDFLRGLATTNNLNLSVEPSLDVKVTSNFSSVSVKDVLLFLCRKHELDITFIGNIMAFTKYTAPPQLAPRYSPKPLNVSFDKNTNLLNLDLSNDSLALLTRELTRITGRNFVFAPELYSKMVSGFIQNVSIEKAMEKLAFANDLKVSSGDDNFFLIEKKEQGNRSNGGNTTTAGLPKGTNIITDNNLVSVDAVNAPISDLVQIVSSGLKLEYFLFSDLKGNATLHLKDATYEEFLRDVFNGTEFTFRKQNDVYYIGERTQEGLRSTKVVQLKYRTVDKVSDAIPGDLKKGVDVKVFPDLNSLILSGSQPRIEEIESFIRDIDRVVPVVLIDVMLIEVSNSHSVSTGIAAGIGTPPSSPNTVLPGVDVTLSSGTLNDLIDGINGFGLINLGHVGPNFYMQLKALEDQSYLKIKSTPKLSTLNGNEAKMSVGKTEYYREQTNQLVGAQQPVSVTTNVFKPVTADLALTINPIVSGDEQITLSISVKQSQFTKRFTNDAPPGTTQRSFESVIRVKNQDMIILGGLEDSRAEDSGSGTPLLSRIPVIKWFFSSRTKSKSKSKLTVLIRPTVIY